MRRRHWVASALFVIALLATAGLAASDNGATNNKTFEFSVGLWGDLPYSDVQAQKGVPNLIADMNNSDISFSIHDGDLKAGSGTPGSITPTTCSDALYTQALGYFNSLRQPAFFTTGDNDWTDCDRPSNGSYNELERLQHERQVFFSTDRSLGQKTMQVEVQTAPLCVGTTNTTAGSTTGPYFPTGCVENRRWTVHNVTFVTLNVQGTCNNLCSSGGGAPDAGGDPTEYAARNAADIQWLRDSFDEARTNGSAAIMIAWQGDPGFDQSDGTRTELRDPRTLVETDGQPDGYHDILSTLRDLTIAFEKPVVLVHGDSHYFRIDKPLLDSKGRRLENFTRVETFGDNQGNGNNDVQWVKALVDPQSRDVFAFQPQIVPANRVAVPAP
jgi:hypothetical protein